jgi:hypothetical protein
MIQVLPFLLDAQPLSPKPLQRDPDCSGERRLPLAVVVWYPKTNQARRGQGGEMSSIDDDGHLRAPTGANPERIKLPDGFVKNAKKSALANEESGLDAARAQAQALAEQMKQDPH